MSKRFTDTGKWDDPWFHALTLAQKMFWVFLCDKCDHAGIWKVNAPLARFHLGADVPINHEQFDGRVIAISDEKWFIKNFINFQYGNLKQDNRVHASIIAILEKEGVCKVPASPLQGAKDKDKDKDKDLDKDKDKDKVRRFIPPTVEEVAAYCTERKNGIDPSQFMAHYEVRDWKPKGYSTQMKSWKAAVQTWERNGYSKPTKDPNKPVSMRDYLAARDRNETQIS